LIPFNEDHSSDAYYATDTAATSDILSKLLPSEIEAFESQIANAQGVASLVPLWTPCMICIIASKTKKSDAHTVMCM
jgi:hypothetical protein